MIRTYSSTLLESLRLPLTMAACFWLVEITEFLLDFNLHNFGIYPRTLHGLSGILLSPFLHGNFTHLISNTPTFIVLAACILFFFPQTAYQVMIYTYLITGIGVWLFARSSYHIGASGLIYGFAAFLFFSGIFRKDVRSMAISLIMAFLYGGMLYGLIPGNQGVSWESHMIGALAGTYCAYIFRNAPSAMDAPDTDPDTEDGDGYRNLEGPSFRYTYKEKKS